MCCECEPDVSAAMAQKPAAKRDLRTWALGLLLIGEVLALTLPFDTAGFWRQTQWWSALLGQSSQFLRIGVSIAAVLLLLSGRGWRTVAFPPGANSPPKRAWAWLIVHGLSFAGFFAASALLFETVKPDAAAVMPLSLAWWLLGGLTLCTWALTVRPLAFWLTLVRRGKGLLLTGAVVGILAYFLGSLATHLWQPLSAGTFALIQLILRPFLHHCSFDPDSFIVRTPTFAIEIAPQCSGYEGIGLVAVFMATYLWIFRGRFRFPRALLLLPIAILAVWLLNAVRIAVLVALGNAGLSQLAIDGFHSQAGWLAFNAVALGLAVLAEHTPLLKAERDVGPSVTGPSTTTVHLAPFLAMIAAGMIARACGADAVWSSTMRAGAAIAVLWYFWRSLAHLGWSWRWPALAIGALTTVIWIGLVSWLQSRAGDTSASPREAGAGMGLLVQLLVYLVVAPVAEELAFRRYLCRRLVSTDFEQVDAQRLPWLAVGLSSLLFGILHGAHWLPATVAGVLFAIAYRQRGQLGDAVVAHATANVLIAAYVLATGQWFLWS